MLFPDTYSISCRHNNCSSNSIHMFNRENVPMKPNILGLSAEEEDKERRKATTQLKDRTNRQRGSFRTKKLQSTGNEENIPPKEKVNVLLDFEEEDKENDSQGQGKQNIFINFDSEECLDEEEGLEQQKKSQIEKNPAVEMACKVEVNPVKSTKGKRDLFLLNLSSEEEEEERESPSKQEEEQGSPKVQDIHRSQLPKPSCSELALDLNSNHNEFLLDISMDDNQSQGNSQSSADLQNGHNSSKSKGLVTLSSLVSDFKDKYYLQPIPRGQVFQCVMKREKNEEDIKYHLYDSQTLRNFMTIQKNDDYLIISRYESGSTKHIHNPVRKERVVGRITSNFFGTQFNCCLEDVVYSERTKYPASGNKKNILTVEYETNLFGLSGPRKMTAFVGEGNYNRPLTQIFEKEEKAKGQKTVHKFRNKMPKWSNEIGSYVLNFHGRAAVSSIKNFIMTGEEDAESAQPRLLFGKFGKELFNMDIRYPFNILQGLALGISSFDRKLACE